MTRCCRLAAVTLCWLLSGSPGLSDDRATDEGNYSGSLVLDVDRDTADAFRAAEGDLESGQLAAGLARLQELLDRSSDVLVEHDASFVSLWELVNERIASLEAAEKSAYQRIVRAQAEAALSAAVNPLDPAALARLTDRYRHSPAGRQSAVLLAALAIDRGDARGAAAWGRFLERHYPGSPLPASLARRQQGEDDVVTESRASDAASTTWSLDLGVSAEGSLAIDGAVADLNAQALTPILTCRPLVVGQRVITRTLTGLICVDATSGDVLWEHPVACHAARLADAPGRLNDPIRTGQVSAVLLRRLVRDSLEDELSSDGDSVFTLVTPDRSAQDNPLWPANSLRAIDIATGKVRWERKPPAPSETGRRARRTAVRQARYFLGPPLADGDQLLVPAQNGQKVELVALDPDSGEVVWSVVIGQAVRDLWPRERPDSEKVPPEDRERQSTACRLRRSGPFVLFPTGAGAIACLDTARQRLLWVHRYARQDLSAVPPSWGDETHFREMPTRDAFTIADAWIVGQNGICLAPDADRILAFDLVSGKLLWSRRRGDVVQVTMSAGADSVLLIGVTKVTSIGIRDGMPRWSTPTQRPAGRAIVDGDRLILPLSGDQYEFFGMNDGHRLTASSRGNGGDALSVTLHPPSSPGRLALRNLEQSADIILSQSATHLARVVPTATAEPPPTLAGGRIDVLLRRIARWRDKGSVPVEVLRHLDGRVSLVDGLLIRVLEQAGLQRSLEKQVEGLLVSLQRAEDEDDTQAVQTLRQQLADRNPHRLYVSTANGLHTCRVDRWIGLSADARSRELLPGSTEPAKQHAASPWPDAEPRVSEHSTNFGLPFIHSIPVTDDEDSIWGDVSVEADRQGRMLQFRDLRHAEPSVIPLSRESGNLRLESRFLQGWTTEDLLLVRIGAELLAFQRPGLGELPADTLWPADGQTMSLQGVRPPLPTSLRILPDEAKPAWDKTTAGIQDVFGRPVGDVGPVCRDYLCYQQRGDIIALDSRTGEELWRRARCPVGTRATGDDDFVVLFHPERPQVTVLDAIDGRIAKTWSLNDVIEASPVTPRTPFVPRQIEGTWALLGWTTGEGLQLQAIDLAEGRSIWRQEVPAGTINIALDRPRIGLAVPSDGQTCEVRFLDSSTGEQISSLELSAPVDLQAVHTFVGAGPQRYLILSGRITDLPLQNVPQILGGLHRPLVNGWLHAFDADASRLLWSQPVENMAFPLVQPRHVPLLLVNDMIQPAGTQSPQGRLLCLDARTGQTLGQLQQSTHVYFTIDADPDSARIDIRMQGRSLRLEYGDASASQP